MKQHQIRIWIILGAVLMALSILTACDTVVCFKPPKTED